VNEPDDLDGLIIDMDAPAPTHYSQICPHGRPFTLPYGLHKCADCGSIEGLDKVWRHADVLWPSR
jgi:hypothetical protein